MLMEKSTKESQILEAVDICTSSELGRKKRRVNKLAQFWALLAAVSMGVTNYIRTVESGTPLPSFFVLGFSYLLISSIALGTLRWHNGSSFKPIFYKPVTEEKDAREIELMSIDSQSRPRLWTFSKAQFALACIAGLAQFGTSLSSILAFN